MTPKNSKRPTQERALASDILDALRAARIDISGASDFVIVNVIEAKLLAAAVSFSELVLLPREMCNRLLCKCGQPLGSDGHMDVCDHNGMTAVSEVRCAKCEEALGKP